ncbi:MAG: UDP-3-O-acyl-N-acetylglucosamine deacetylase [Holosporaceae bacterium]|nr:UDP-3-O-acyl-N-acetylglucosamine deacetylase [Holosporaceae bacterium]
MLLQCTLKSKISLDGIGVHSGASCDVSVFPAPESTGIVFRSDGYEGAARFDRVSGTTLCTVLSLESGYKVSTVEHLMAAFGGLGITNAIAEVHNSEVPILDGSALPFVDAFLSAGLEQQSQCVKMLKILEVVRVQEEGKWVSLSPADSFSLNIVCDFTPQGLKTDPAFFDFSKNDFSLEIAPARSFGFFVDIEYLRKNNFALGASLDNCVVFDDCGTPLNDGDLRLHNEPVCHKLLDAIGDLSLAQYRILGRFDGVCPGHRLNNALLRKVFEKSSNYEIVRCIADL